MSTMKIPRAMKKTMKPIGMAGLMFAASSLFNGCTERKTIKVQEWRPIMASSITNALACGQQVLITTEDNGMIVMEISKRESR